MYFSILSFIYKRDVRYRGYILLKLIVFVDLVGNYWYQNDQDVKVFVLFKMVLRVIIVFIFIKEN